MEQVRHSSWQFAGRGLLPLGVALIASATLQAQTASGTNAPPRPAPTWPYQVPFGSSKTPATVTPGGTFSRPQSTFQTSPGSFARPSSTFSHPASPYTPLPPLRPSQIEEPGFHSRPHHRFYPNVVVVQGPAVYEPYYVPAEQPSTQLPQQPYEQAAQPSETPVVEAPVVIDLPPGAIIRRPAAPAPAPAAGAPPQSASAGATNAPVQVRKE